MTAAILALAVAAAAFAALTYWSIRTYHKAERAERTDRLTIMHAQNLAGRNGHDPTIHSIISGVGDEADDTFGPDSFR